jgi:flavodoxin
MRSVVVYATRHRNTKKVAEAIVHGLHGKGSVDIFEVDQAPVTFDEDVDLVVAGGPTEAHSVTEPMREYLDRLARASLSGVIVASFDTRMRWPSWVSGAASRGIAKSLEAAGGRPLLPPESFFVKGSPPELEAGELERAEGWGRALAEKLASRERSPETVAV